jgi:valyl-tRNA synthetase
MIMTGMHFMKREPFHTVFIHGLVRDAKGKKMSKSFGNVIDPLEIIDKVGADALRFALISLITGQGQDIKLTQDKITEARNFANKIWNVSRFVLMNLEPTPSAPGVRPDIENVGSIPKDLELADKWIISRYNNLIKNVTDLMEDYDLGEAARKIYEFLWGEFCDWYIEISKNDLYLNDAKKKEKAQNILVYILEGTLRLLHPFMPYITEEIWQLLKNKLGVKNSPKSIFSTAFPVYDKSKIDQKSETEMGLYINILTQIRDRKSKMGVQTKEVDVSYFTEDKKERDIISRGEGFIKSLGKVGKSKFLNRIEDRPRPCASGMASNIKFFIPLEDVGKEVERLNNQQQKIEKEVERLKKLLSNKNFTSKAPPEVVEKQRATINRLTEEKKFISERLKDLAS